MTEAASFYDAVGGSDTFRRLVDGFYAGVADDPVLRPLYPDEDWELAPAILGGDPANLFAFFPTYQRGAMTVEGYREIVGDQTFFAFAHDLLADRAHGNISTDEFIAAAKSASGFSGAKLALLDDYFQQWLYGETKPTIVPGDFS